MLRDEVRVEAARIFAWWARHMPDKAYGGFHGEIDAHDRPVADAAKSVILNTRLLWFFSAMAIHLKSAEALALAHRAAGYIRDHFLDRDHGGVVWRLDSRGRVLDGRKQAYAQAFALYGFSEYFAATGDAAALMTARDLQGLIESRFRDPGHGGYVEALGRDWSASGDQRLSDRDVDAPKTMNSHLHILEAYSRLHAVAPDTSSRLCLAGIIGVFVARFATGRHLRLFRAMDWSDRTLSVSYGHDIEASWLIWEAAQALGDAETTARVRPVVLALARATLDEGFNAMGGLSYECRFDGAIDPDGEWWGQAEGLVGFVNAWQMTGEAAFLTAAERLWSTIKAQYRDGDHEWTWYARDAHHPPMYRAGAWKCPYHNGRAMLELEKRLGATA